MAIHVGLAQMSWREESMDENTQKDASERVRQLVEKRRADRAKEVPPLRRYLLAGMAGLLGFLSIRVTEEYCPWVNPKRAEVTEAGLGSLSSQAQQLEAELRLAVPSADQLTMEQKRSKEQVEIVLRLVSEFVKQARGSMDKGDQATAMVERNQVLSLLDLGWREVRAIKPTVPK